MSPPLALTSSRQISSASRFCLPLGATAPVSAMLKPTLIGSAARAGTLAQSKPTSRIASEANETARRANIGNLLPPPLFDGTARLTHSAFSAAFPVASPSLSWPANAQQPLQSTPADMTHHRVRSSDRHRLARCLRNITLGRVAQAENAAGVVVEDLLPVFLRQPDFVEQLERGRRIPAGIVGAVHHVIDAVVVDGEFHPSDVRRHRVGVHALEVAARRPRQLGRPRILVHAPGLVGPRA